MNDAMHKFNLQLFKKAHKSYYNDEDLLMLNENRTVPPTGLLKKRNILCDEREIDRNKAYTSEMKLITKIPKFTVFDVWTAYDNSEIQDYTLYTVRSKKTNLLFNKRNTLMYGLILK